MALQSVGIVGGGAWGTALGVSARRAGRDVILWAYEPETVAEINGRIGTRSICLALRSTLPSRPPPSSAKLPPAISC